MLYEALLIPPLCEEPNGTQITPPEPIGIFLNSDLHAHMVCKAQRHPLLVLSHFHSLHHFVVGKYRHIMGQVHHTNVQEGFAVRFSWRRQS